MKINERSLIEGLSYALDAAEKSYFSHAKHVAYLAILLAKELNLTLEEQKDIYYAGLLHDIGASEAYSVENNSYIREHCEYGRDIVIELPLKSDIAEYIYFHHEFYNGTGVFNLKGDEIPIASQILCITNLFDVKFSYIEKWNYEKLDSVMKWIEENKEKFNPEVLEAFCRLICRESMLLDYFNSEFNSILLKKINLDSRELDYDDMKIYAYTFAKIIDNRSPFTYRHSTEVAKLVYRLTSDLGFDEDTQNKMYIAALLHDIGKLVVSNDILDKPGKLDDSERFEINKHTYYTRWILDQIDGFEEITDVAANHHEKLNGRGYPLQLESCKIGELDRIMAICDIYQALTEERPYRDNLPIEKVWSIIDSMVERGEIDGVLVEKIKEILCVKV